MTAGMAAVSDHWPLLIAAAGAFFVAIGWCSRWLWRLMTRVRHFQTAGDGQILLHYAPGLDAHGNLAILFQRCRAELDRLTQQFGSPLRGRVIVFLFARHQEIAKIFGPHYGGAALESANAIVIADDSGVPESIRHELAHLYSARWNRAAPPLLNEGLSMWLQETVGTRPIDIAARCFLDDRSLKLVRLLKPTFFFAEPQRHACYVLAGSFTGFLIRRYGWQRYRTLFRHCQGERFHAPFEKCLGIDLETAERQWRNEMMIREALSLGSDDFAASKSRL